MIEVLYIIPNDKGIIISDDIAIHKFTDPSRGSKWKDYKIEETVIMAYNDAYHGLDIENCPILKM